MNKNIFPNLTEAQFNEKIEPFMNRTKWLSASTLSRVTTPVDFVQYLFEPPKETAGMGFGSIVDTMITKADKFDEEYIVSDKALTTDLQKQVAKDTLEMSEGTIEERFAKAYTKNYSRGKPENNLWMLEVIKQMASGKKIIPGELYGQAKKVADNLMSKPELCSIFEVAEFQHKMIFEHRGWKFIGYPDIISEGHIYDLKFSSQLDPDNFHRTVEKYNYDLQAGCYVLGLSSIAERYVEPDFYFIAYDARYNYDIMQLSEEYLQYGVDKLNYHLDKLEWMIENNDWFGSYGKFRDRIHKIELPKWVKGFDYGFMNK